MKWLREERRGNGMGNTLFGYFGFALLVYLIYKGVTGQPMGGSGSSRRKNNNSRGGDSGGGSDE